MLPAFRFACFSQNTVSVIMFSVSRTALSEEHLLLLLQRRRRLLLQRLLLEVLARGLLNGQHHA